MFCASLSLCSSCRPASQLSGARTDRSYAALPIAPRIKPPKAVHVDGTPEPPEPEPEKPPPKELVEKGIPESWKVIDLSDIAYEMALLRDAILSAMDDGQVDREEETIIINMMVRSGEMLLAAVEGEAAVVDSTP